jgi:hypothetical protein
MSFNRAVYDNCEYKHKLNETISPMNYMLDRPWECDPCIPYQGGGPIINRHGDSICDKELIDVDSELIGINRKYSKCPADKYLPNPKPFCKTKKHFKECDFLIPEHTLISNPKCTNKETTINRWEWLCRDPQANVLVPFDFQINNRIVVKDNHRPLLEIPINQENSLPDKCNDDIVYDWASKWYNNACFPSSVQLGRCPR